MDKNLIDISKSLAAIETFCEMITDISVMDGVDQRRELTETLVNNIKLRAKAAKDSATLVFNSIQQADDRLLNKSLRETDD